MRVGARIFSLAAVTFLAVALSCGGNPASAPAAPAPPTSPALPPGSYDVCHCTPTGTESSDYRHAAKHAELPVMAAQAITVDEILSWPQGTALAADAARSGRELQVFQIARAFLQNVYVNPGDCDIHFEISETADAGAPRVIVETADNPSYCTARQNIQTQLAAHGLMFPAGGNVVPALPVIVTGMAFQDFEHKRGGPLVATTWELHPAVVTILPQ
jgi:hypothetical protein